MSNPKFAAFDLGASSGRGLVGELDDRALVIRECCRFPNGMIDVRGRLHWDIFGLYGHIKEGLRRCMGQMDSSPLSLGIDAWGVDFGLLGSDGGILDLPYGYRDGRFQKASESFFRKMPKERVYELTGIQFLPFNTLFQLEAMARDRSPHLDAATDLLFMPDLLTYLLTGIKKSEFTIATTSQLYNTKKNAWEGELFEALGLPMSLMQEVVMPGTPIGNLAQEVADELGVEPIPVVSVATHDTGSAVAAVPAEGEDWAYISSGTWSLMGIETKAPIINEKSLENDFTNEGGVQGTIRFLRNIAGLWLLEECRRIWAAERKYKYDELMNLAEAAPPFASLIDPDHKDFLSPTNMPNAIHGACKNTRQKPPEAIGEFVRCILESLALKYRYVLNVLRQSSPHPINRLHVIGGGAHNRTLCQFTSNATGLPVIAGPTEATAIGNIMVQAMSFGHVTSLSEMRAVIRNSFDLVHYEPENTTIWDSAYERFIKVCESEVGPK